MIERIISWSTHNRFFIWLGIIMIVIRGIYAIRETPMDALPDLSENQVIVFTEWMGRTPQCLISSFQLRSWLCSTAEAAHPTWKTFSIFSK